ncbi:MAG: transposase [Acidobacteriaceae bacterium]|nr:transposase [Acidobacteriaceae bacterium]
MDSWMRQSAELLIPLYERLKQFVLASKAVGTDDTPVRVLGRQLPHARKGRIWFYVGDRDHPAVIYNYIPTRNVRSRRAFLKVIVATCSRIPMLLMTASLLSRNGAWWRWAAGHMPGGMCIEPATPI